MHVNRNICPVDAAMLSGDIAEVTLGERIREARLAKGLGQRGLAEASGVSQGHISHAESGKRQELGPTVLGALARALEVSPEWLLTGEGPRVRYAASTDADDPYPARAAAIVRMRGLVSESAIARVRADQLLGALSEAEWVEELLRADRIERKGLPRNDGQPHAGDGPVGRASSKIARK